MAQEFVPSRDDRLRRFAWPRGAGAPRDGRLTGSLQLRRDVLQGVDRPPRQTHTSSDHRAPPDLSSLTLTADSAARTRAITSLIKRRAPVWRDAGSGGH